MSRATMTANPDRQGQHRTPYPRGHAPFAVLNQTVNRGLIRMLRTPMVHHLISHRIALITVTGCKSGRELKLPVSYRQREELVRIPVAFSARKLWWRNLRGSGATVRIRLRGRERQGHAKAEEHAKAGVVVNIQLERA
jgi:F420H(2)-dependent quinone reductase